MSADQRQFVRWPTIDDDCISCLIVNGRTIRCQLVELSIGGFGVIAQQAVEVGSHERVVLKSHGSEYVVRVKFQKPSEDCFFIGLERIEEIFPANMMPRSRAPWLVSVAWTVACGTVAAALYCLISQYESLPM